MTVTLSTSFVQEDAMEFTLTLNHELNNIKNWITSHRICIDADKTQYMIYSHTKNYDSYLILKLDLQQQKKWNYFIEVTNNIKFLEIIFDKHLTFKNHSDL